MSDPLASLRASLKAGKPIAKTAPTLKPDPLASLRASLKSGKSLNTGMAKPAAKPAVPTDTRLSQLEYAVDVLISHLGLPPRVPR